jgi:hypothetical protein
MTWILAHMMMLMIWNPDFCLEQKERIGPLLRFGRAFDSKLVFLLLVLGRLLLSL